MHMVIMKNMTNNAMYIVQKLHAFVFNGILFNGIAFSGIVFNEIKFKVLF